MPDWKDSFDDAISWSPPPGVWRCVRVLPDAGYEVAVTLSVDGTHATLSVPANRTRAELHAALDHAVRCLSPWPEGLRDCPCGCNDTPYARLLDEAGRKFARKVRGPDECDGGAP